MTRRKILIVDGHPDADPGHFVHALADAYARGAAGHEVRTLRIASLAFPVLRDPRDWMQGAVPDGLAEAQASIRWADHLVLLFPLWLGDMPALVKAFLEQTLRPGFALRYGEGPLPEKLLGGRSARVIVTMGMPAAAYEMFYRAHSLKSLERNILKFVGFAPVRRTVLGPVAAGDDQRRRWLEEVEALGVDAA